MKSSRGWRFLTTISLVEQEQLQLQLAVCDIIWALVNLLQQYDLYMLITMNIKHLLLTKVYVRQVFIQHL
jgi:hypothetical protein